MKPDPRTKKGRSIFQALFAKTHDNAAIIDFLSARKSRQQFTKWIVDMWKLWRDLTDGNVTELICQFPHMASQVNGASDATVQQLFEQQAEILRKLQALGAQPITTGTAMNVPKLAKPTFDDEEDTVPMGRDMSTDGSLNFLNAAFSLQDAQQ